MCLLFELRPYLSLRPSALALRKEQLGAAAGGRRGGGAASTEESPATKQKKKMFSAKIPKKVDEFDGYVSPQRRVLVHALSVGRVE